MANERKTEDIVRTHFKKYQNIIKIEEQQSDNPKIKKLLKNASKSGGGTGYPEFIITFKENPDFLIVIECKADIKYHKSNTLDKYKDYAVDGALLYASFLSKEYDVLAIGVSGENEKELKVSHYLQLKGTDKAFEIFGDKLLAPIDYEEGYKKDERKFNQDFQALLNYSKILNNKLHTLRVKESERSLLISGTLIALSDKAFYNAYKYKTPQELSKFLVNTIEEKLTKVQNEYIKDIIKSFDFIQTHTILSTKEHVLRDIIDEIDEKINSFIKTYKYFDTLGQFYIEFLRYANNDKGLGIVLTPPHITELFCDIANINKDSVILDPCTGTGGFLISAMKKMILDTAGDKKKELEIKQKQIIGVEIQHDIFSLLCANMYIHGDGRSNLFKGSCFDDKIKEKIKKFNPNVAFLNPPYKTKKDDIEELEFVLNALEMIQKGSICVAIVPMSCMLAKNGKRLELKEKLLQNHTLEAVFSMPDELFVNSKVGVITSICVFKAKEKHPQNYKTYFGYWKDDGFYKRKTNGRADYDNKWSKIKQFWLSNYQNKDEIEGHSVKYIVTAKDEWCAEAYMKTDYSVLNKDLFEKEVLKYSTYLFFNRKKSFVSNKKISKQKIPLNLNNFEEYLIKDLFNIEKGRETNNLGKGDIPLVSATRENNGISGYVDDPNKIFEENLITVVSNGASTGEAFYQNERFCATGDVNILKPKFDLNVYKAMFIITVIRLEKYRFNYGRKWGKERMENSIIKLPTKNNEPDWEFMEEFIKSLPYSANLKSQPS